MGLRIQRVTRVKVLSTLIAVFALVAQPLYGVVSSQVAGAADQPRIVSLDAYYVKNTYQGVGTDIYVNGLTDVTSVQVSLNRADGTSVSKTSKSSVNQTLSTGEAANVTAPLVLKAGTYTDGTSSSWTPTTLWTGASLPVSVTVQITYDGGKILTEIDDTISENLALQSEAIPVYVNAPTIFAKNSDGTLVSGGYTTKSDVTATWTTPVGSIAKYEYAYWNNIPGNKYNSESSAWKTDVAGAERSGSFNQGEGTHYMKVRAYDTAGNVSGWSNVFVVNYDKTAPTAPVALIPMGWSNNADVAFNWSAAGDASVVTYEVITGVHPNLDANGKLQNGVTSLASDLAETSVTKTLTDGPYFWQVRAKDAVGNYSSWSNVGVLTLDTTKPSISSNLTNGQVLDGTQTVTQTVDEKYPKAYQFYLYNSDNQVVKIGNDNVGEYIQDPSTNQLSKAINTRQIANGNYYFLFSARDIIGNQAEQLKVPVIIDNTIALTSSYASNYDAFSVNVKKAQGYKLKVMWDNGINTTVDITSQNYNWYSGTSNKFTESFRYQVLDGTTVIASGSRENTAIKHVGTWSEDKQSFGVVAAGYPGNFDTVIKWQQNGAEQSTTKTIAELRTQTGGNKDKWWSGNGRGNVESFQFEIRKPGTNGAVVYASGLIAANRPVVEVPLTQVTITGVEGRTVNGTVRDRDATLEILQYKGLAGKDGVMDLVVSDTANEDGSYDWSFTAPAIYPEGEVGNLEVRFKNQSTGVEYALAQFNNVTFSAIPPVGGSEDEEDEDDGSSDDESSIDAASDSSQNSGPLLRVATPITGVLNPVTTPVFGNAAGSIGGVADTDGQSNAVVNPEVLGAQDTRLNVAQAANPIDASSEGWKVFGVAWYWYAVLAALAAGIWWLLAGLKRRNGDNPTL